MNCRLCPGPACDPAFHASSARVRAWLRERVTAILSQPSRAELLAPKRQEVPRRPEGAPAVGVIPSPQTLAANRARKEKRDARGLTVEAILARQREGATLMQIAEEYSCSFALVSKKLRLACDSSEFRAAYQALRTCPTPECGRVKWPSRPVCNRCATAARALAKRKAA
jgi:hypothetical protein